MLLDIILGGLGLSGIIAYILSALAVVFLTLPIHEYAHGLIATKLGDPTPKYQGRLTLNPFAHIDYLGAACILLFGFGWAKPVEVNARYFKNPKWDMALVALAGPVSNIIMAFIFLLLGNVIFILPIPDAFTLGVSMFFRYVAYINVYLAVFNLIPIPPLDGSRLLSALLPTKLYYALMRNERILFYVVLALIWTGILSEPLSYATDFILNGIDTLAGLPFMLL